MMVVLFSYIMDTRMHVCVFEFVFVVTQTYMGLVTIV